MAATAWNAAPAVVRDLVSDERLARLASRGDERAFGTLFSRYRPDLERYCRSILRNGADAEDAAQNAMVSALRALEAGTTPMRVKPWLYKIAHNEAISLARRRRPVEDIDDHALAAATGLEDASAIRERLGQLMADLKALTERQREALVLRELFGMTYREIAQTLGASEAAAQQTVFEARSALMVFGEGRAMACEQIQRAMSDCDGMSLRTRRFRAHVRGCPGCREFETSLAARRRDLGMLFPSSTGAGLLAGLARLLGFGGGADRLAAALGIKGAAIGAALLAGGGALIVASADTGRTASSQARQSSPTSGVVAAPTRSAAPVAAKQSAHATRSAATPTRTETHRKHQTATPPAATAPLGDNAPTPQSAGNATEVASTDTSAGGGDSSGGGSTSDRGHTGSGSGGTTTSPVHAPGNNPISNTVNQTLGTVNQTVDNTVTTVTDTANQVVNNTTTTATNVVNQTTTTATDVIKKTTGGIGLP
jgi:RNA polymerase sigma factor (sigma-70 family)